MVKIKSRPEFKKEEKGRNRETIKAVSSSGKISKPKNEKVIKNKWKKSIKLSNGKLEEASSLNKEQIKEDTAKVGCAVLLILIDSRIHIWYIELCSVYSSNDYNFIIIESNWGDWGIFEYLKLFMVLGICEEQ